MATVYVWADMGGYEQDLEGHYFTSLREARASLRAYLSAGYKGEYDDGTMCKQIDIEKLDIGRPSIDLVLDILNERGFVRSRVPVEALISIPCGKCDFCESEATHNCQHKKVVRHPINPSTRRPFIP